MEDLQLVSLIVGVLVAWSGVMLWAIKAMLDRSQKHFDDRFSSEATRLDRVERGLEVLKGELASNYVQREDWIRCVTALTSKLDTIWSRLDAISLGVRNGNDR